MCQRVHRTDLRSTLVGSYKVMSTCKNAHIRTYRYRFVHSCIYIYKLYVTKVDLRYFLYIYLYIHIHIYMYVYVYIYYQYTYIYVYIWIYIYAHMYMYVCVPHLNTSHHAYESETSRGKPSSTDYIHGSQHTCCAPNTHVTHIHTSRHIHKCAMTLNCHKLFPQYTYYSHSTLITLQTRMSHT